jgi:TonB family protein
VTRQQRNGSRSAAVALVLVACVSTTTRYFVPSTQNPIYRPEQATPVLSEYVRLQCPAFRQASRPDSGRVSLTVDVDTSGFATRAELTKSSGDKLLDDVFGTVAAQLVFPRDTIGPRKPRREYVVMDFRCSGDSAQVRIR